VRTEALTHTARWHILLCAVSCLLAIPPLYAQSFSELKSKAEAGDVQAQLALAKAYHLGDGVAKDEAQAVLWWEKAAEHGDVAGQTNLGIAYQLGAGVPKNYAAAVRWYGKAADQGNAQAQSDLAVLYHLGQGVPKDDAEAVRWWKKAAEQGDVTAQGNLGTAYGLGTGVPKDDAESLRWHTKAAENGNAASQFTLGMAYVYGKGIPKDEAEGVKWLRKSAEQGNAGGQFWLGAAYYSGTGVAKDTAEALRWYRKAAEQGYAAAQYDLGQAYNLGNGVEQDTAEAVRWWQKAAEQGLAKAQYNLGLAYRAGAGVEKDNVQAYFWIVIAGSSLEQGFVKDYRDKVEAVLTPAQLTDVQGRIHNWEEAHPATQTASLNSLPSVPQDQQQTQTQDHPQSQGIRPVFVKATTCDGKLASVLFSSFKEAISTSQRHELVRDLSDNGKMDTVLTIQMACEEHNNSVSVRSAYGMAKCFGPKNCHAALDGRTSNVLSCDPNGEAICGKELFKEFEYVLATTGINVKLE
jgi:TPR repeat protein